MSEPRVVVTGALRGIGAATVEHLVTSRYRVVAVDRDVEDTSMTHPGRVMWYRLDVSSEDAVEALESELRVDPPTGLVNCAGTVDDVRLPEVTLGQWQSSLQDNLTSAFLMIRSFARLAIQGGAVVNVGSCNAWNGHPRRVGYSVAKGGIEALTRTSAGHLGSRGIRVNAVLPGAILTRMTTDSARAASRAALGRIGSPHEVAEAIEFLLSDRASYITGSTLNVDGGVGLS